MYLNTLHPCCSTFVVQLSSCHWRAILWTASFSFEIRSVRGVLETDNRISKCASECERSPSTCQMHDACYNILVALSLCELRCEIGPKHALFRMHALASFWWVAVFCESQCGNTPGHSLHGKFRSILGVTLLCESECGNTPEHALHGVCDLHPGCGYLAHVIVWKYT